MSIDHLLFLWNPTTGVSGSGRWVTPDLVLTAHHVIFGLEQGAAPARKMHVATREQIRGTEQAWAIAHCVWSNAGTDAALLRLAEHAILGRFPKPVSWGALYKGVVVEKLDALGFPQFRAEGFPDSFVTNARRRDEPAFGSARDFSLAGDSRLQFQIQSARPDQR
ncbi:MAG: trypsin-like serine protease [Gammaproteobacteria bacterium]|nr:trypsin-like serine protease [Gammaproteobacteria bacterium]